LGSFHLSVRQDHATGIDAVQDNAHQPLPAALLLHQVAVVVLVANLLKPLVSVLGSTGLIQSLIGVEQLLTHDQAMMMTVDLMNELNNLAAVEEAEEVLRHLVNQTHQEIGGRIRLPENHRRCPMLLLPLTERAHRAVVSSMRSGKLHQRAVTFCATVRSSSHGEIVTGQ
jgi:hypothetical protein